MAEAVGGFVVRVKDVTGGDFSRAYVKLTLKVDNDTDVSDLKKAVRSEFKRWGEPSEDDISLFLVPIEGTKPTPTEEQSALDHLLDPMDSLTTANVKNGCCLLTKCTGAAVAGATGGAATARDAGVGGSGQAARALRANGAEEVLLPGAGGVAIEPVMPLETMLRARKALFAILDRRGHPVGCGFFVTSSGVALTVHHFVDWMQSDRSAPGRQVVKGCRLGASGAEVEMTFAVVSTDMELDFTVLRLVGSSAGTLYYPLPAERLPDEELWGHSARLVHGNLALNAQFGEPPDASVTVCNISTVHTKRLLYSAATSAGDSGGALLLRGTNLVGLHVEGVNDVIDSPRGKRFKTPSEASSPSTSACALRLDIDEVRQAVEQAEMAAQQSQGR